jgi:hypothetical protein
MLVIQIDLAFRATFIKKGALYESSPLPLSPGPLEGPSSKLSSIIAPTDDWRDTTHGDISSSLYRGWVG